MNSLLTEVDNVEIPRIEFPRLTASVFTEHTFLCRRECSQSLDEHGFLKVHKGFFNKQKENRVEDYLKWVSSSFDALQDGLKESVMMLSNAAIEYNQKRIELFRQKRKEDESQYPILHLDIDDILNGSFTGSRLEELQRMLDEVTEEEKKRERTLLSGESIVGLSRTALSFACQHFSPSAFQCLVNIFRQNHSIKEGRG